MAYGASPAAFNDPIYGFTDPLAGAAPAPPPGAPPGALSGAAPAGPLSGLSGLFGPATGGLADFLQSGVPAGVGGALLAGHGLPTYLGTQVPQIAADAQRRAAVNNWLGGQKYDPQTMQLLRSDPALAESIVTGQLTPHRQFSQIGVDALGNPTYGFVDPFNQTVTPAGDAVGGPATPGAVAGSAPTAGQAGAAPITGQAGGAPAAGQTGGTPATPGGSPLYNQLGKFPGMQQQVDAIIQGRAAPYTQRAASSPGAGKAIMAAVYERDPTYDAGRYDTRQAFEHGKDADTISAGQTAISHLNEVSKAAARLAPFAASTGLSFYDYLRNRLSNAAVMGSGSEEAQALNAFNTAKQLYSAEKVKFYAGAGGGESDREAGQAAFDAAKSPAEIQAGAAQEADLLQGKVSALQSKYHAAMGPTVPDYPIIRKQDQANLEAVRARYQTAISGGTATGGGTTTSGGPVKITGGPVKITGDADYAKLKSGQHFIGPDKLERVKP